jgi:RND family efflux transporter MFP subunit
MTVRPRSFLLAVVFAVACKQGGGDAAEETVQAVVGAQTVVVTAQPFTETVVAIGSVVPRAGHAASLSAPAPGRVSRVLVTSGQRVSAGQPLVVLDPSTVDAAVQSAEAAVTLAQQTVDRTLRLVGEGVLPRKDAEQAAAEVARARAELVALRRTQTLGTLRSPISGVVTRMTATLGASVDPSQPLVDIADPSALDILLSATPSEAARIRPGAKVTLSAGQGAAGEPLGVGTVADVGATIDSATRSVTVRVRAPATRRVLRIGETVSGRIVVATHAAAVVVPAEALVPEGDGFKVFVVDSESVAHARPVTVGGRSDAGVEITDGLKPGERIVTYGAYGVSDSAKVVPPSQAGQPLPEAKEAAETTGAKADTTAGAKAGEKKP